MTTLVSNIITVPDAEAGRNIFQLDDLADKGVYKAMLHLRHQHHGSNELPPHQQRVAAISVIEASKDGEVKMPPLECSGDDEAELLRAWCDSLGHVTEHVAWDLHGLTVAKLRLLKHGISCPALHRVSERADEGPLQTQLAGGCEAELASLTELAAMLEIPAMPALSAEGLLAHWQAGDHANIQQFSDYRVLQTWLIQQRYAHQRGDISGRELAERHVSLSAVLNDSKQEHLQQFATGMQTYD